MNSDDLELINATSDEITEIKKFIDKDKFSIYSKYLISYSVIKSSGTIEKVFKNILFIYLTQSTLPETKNYLELTLLNNSRNPSTGVIQSSLESLNPNWATLFLKMLDSNNKSDLNSLVKIRNEFAHGNAITISIENVSKYYSSGIKILKILDSIVK